MKKIAPFFVFLIILFDYLAGILLLRIINAPFVEGIKIFSNAYFRIVIFYIIFSIIPFLLFLFSRNKNIWATIFFGSIALILPLFYLIYHIRLFSSPIICGVVNFNDPSDIIVRLFIIILSLVFLWVIIKTFWKYRLSVFISLTVILCIDLLLIQGWIFILLKSIG